MADELYGGALNDFADSMAREIEKAFGQARQEAGLPPLPLADTPDRRERRTLFIAIARGVINHLKQNENAFQLNTTGGAHTHINSNGEHSHVGQTTIQVKAT
jgi:hypothetical protein